MDKDKQMQSPSMSSQSVSSLVKRLLLVHTVLLAFLYGETTLINICLQRVQRYQPTMTYSNLFFFKLSLLFFVKNKLLKLVQRFFKYRFFGFCLGFQNSLPKLQQLKMLLLIKLCIIVIWGFFSCSLCSTVG